MSDEKQRAEEGMTPQGTCAESPPPRRHRFNRRHARAIKALSVPLTLLIVMVLALGGTLQLLDPEHGIWTDALLSSWGNESYTLSGLSHPVEIVRDGAGTVHIFAPDDADLFYAQGFVQASDRLFQMEAQSLMAQGNLSSWVGKSALKSDLAFRYLGIPHAASEIASGIATEDPEVAADLTDYSDGVNAYIGFAEANSALPLPFKALEVTPYKWTPYASISFERLMALSQTSGIGEPLEAAIAANTIGDSSLNALYPIYSPDWQNFTVLPGNGTIANETVRSLQGVNSSYVYSQDWSAPGVTGISTGEGKMLVPLYRAALHNLSDPYLAGFGSAAVSQGVGSNSWVVAANRTGMGIPLLANDPHLPLQLPSLWIPTQLSDPNYNVEGWALAGLPGVLIGHNVNMAWGLTYSGGASALDYVETLSGESYLLNGTWRSLTFQNQTINVAGGKPVSLSVPWTSNGPLVARVGNYGISVRWDGSGPTWEVTAEFAFDRAVSIAQMTGLLERTWDIPTLNFIMAEHNSSSNTTHIGWIIPTHYRLIQVTLPDGQALKVIGERAPLNGSGQFEPVGTIPPNLSPQTVDPARGYLYAPNQASVGQDFPYPFIGGWWDPGGRAHTIGTYLNTHKVMNATGMEALQANVTDSWAVMFSPVLRSALTNISQSGSGSQAQLARAAIPVMQSWNGSFQTSSVASTIYSYWWNEILGQVYSPILATIDVPTGSPPDPNQVFYLGTEDPSSPLFPGGFAKVVDTAAANALTLLSQKLGTGSGTNPDLSGWIWGRVHTFFLPSILGYRSFGEGPYPEWGDSFTPGVAPFTQDLTIPLTQVSIGSSLRMVTAPSPAPSWGIMPGGTSGNVASAYYANQLPLWLGHNYLDMSLVPTASGAFPGGVVSTWYLNP